MNLDGFLPSLPRPNPHRLFARNDEDLPVTDPSRLRRRLDGLHHLFTLAIRHDPLDLHLRKKIDGRFRPPVELGMPLLSAESLHLTDREPLDADLRQGILHLVQLERLDDRFDLLHHPLPTLQESIRLPHSRGPFPFMASPPRRAASPPPAARRDRPHPPLRSTHELPRRAPPRGPRHQASPPPPARCAGGDDQRSIAGTRPRRTLPSWRSSLPRG